MTYGIYLLHPITILLVDNSLRLSKIDYKNSYLGIFGASLLLVVFTLALSWFSYNYFEKYFLKLKSKFQIVKSQDPTKLINQYFEN